MEAGSGRAFVEFRFVECHATSDHVDSRTCLWLYFRGMARSSCHSIGLLGFAPKSGSSRIDDRAHPLYCRALGPCGLGDQEAGPDTPLDYYPRAYARRLASAASRDQHTERADPHARIHLQVAQRGPLPVLARVEDLAEVPSYRPADRLSD